jgi:hypothetical protein
MKTALLMLIFVATASPVLAKPHHAHQNSGQTARSGLHINCETVRAYAGQVGLVQAKALARAAGMTASQERRARECLAEKN